MGGSVHVQEMGYLARSFKESKEGKAILATCEAKVTAPPSVPHSLPPSLLPPFLPHSSNILPEKFIFSYTDSKNFLVRKFINPFPPSLPPALPPALSPYLLLRFSGAGLRGMRSGSSDGAQARPPVRNVLLSPICSGEKGGREGGGAGGRVKIVVAKEVEGNDRHSPAAHTFVALRF
jgi:hypothetical protein